MWDYPDLPDTQNIAFQLQKSGYIGYCYKYLGGPGRTTVDMVWGLGLTVKGVGFGINSSNCCRRESGESCKFRVQGSREQDVCLLHTLYVPLRVPRIPVEGLTAQRRRFLRSPGLSESFIQFRDSRDEG